MQNKQYPPVTLCILDGWGHNPQKRGNAIRAGRTPTFDYFNANFPPAFIHASGEYVGLPDGQMGNSEVGHLNIGAGRVVMQELPKINKAISDGSFFKNPVLGEGIAKALAGGGAYHLVGLLSDGGVHSHINHLEALLKKARQDGMTDRVFIHALMDGRDVPPTSGAGYMARIVKTTREIGVGKIATVCGRYYGMDRDNRWERVEKAYKAIVGGEGVFADDPVEAITASYARGVTDEFILPTVIARDGFVRDGDTVQFFNFRADRARQMVCALSEPKLTHFNRGKKPNVNIYCMTAYSEDFNFPAAFETRPPRNGLGEVISRLGLRQFRTAETEKYAHVTFFFNGGLETEYEGETRKLVPSPKVATYDLKPEMSAIGVADEVVNAVNSGLYGMVIVNFANGDMVGHTAVFPACVKAVETVDGCLGRIMEAVKNKGGWLVVTADHGNIEEKLDADDRPITAHSTNPVPFYVFGAAPKKLADGGDRALCDVAPTVLKLMGIKQPPEMTGRPLF